MDDSFALSSVNDLQRMLLCEQHNEVRFLPYLLKITKTDFGVSLGLPSSFWDGSYTEDGERKMIRLQDVIHKGAWKKHLLRPSPHTLPSGFTIIHFSLTSVAIDYTRFFLFLYSKRYRALPDESKKILYNGARACAIWESFSEKIILQERGIQAFACPWVYQQIIKGREIFDTYPQKIREINAAAKAYRNSRGYYGYSAAEAYDRRRATYTSLNAQVEALATLQLPDLAPLPLGAPVLQLLEEPPGGVFAEAGA